MHEIADGNAPEYTLTGTRGIPMKTKSTFLAAIVCAMILAAANPVGAEEMPWVVVSKDRTGFVLESSGKPFVPWGFNYDHDDSGRLIEDYWESEWPTVETHFAQMKKLGANVVRIHLQLGRFMNGPAEPNRKALDRLALLLALAEKERLYLDLTGLGCYHKQDVPAWYDTLGEQERWDVQAGFWQAVAANCAGSPAVFCYDLMNEPVVPGGKRMGGEWLGRAFAGKHFVQFITLDQQDRPRPEIAQAWVKHLTTAIREKDRRHLLTVGLVDWSLDRPGLNSGFVPAKIAGDLDFLCVHLYPEQGKLDDAIKTLAGFSVGKPVVIEETFPLKCSMDEFAQFLQRSQTNACGWIGFYWGKPPEELRRSKEIKDAILLGWLDFFVSQAPFAASTLDGAEFRNVTCEGTYQHHLQGICADNEAIYWCFTTQLVKTDLNGKLLKKVQVAYHHGDLCFHDGRLYVAVNLGKFNDPKGNADSSVYVYEASDLSFVTRHETQEVFHGAGGIGIHNGRFFVVGGLPDGVDENYVYEYDGDFKFLKKHVIPSGHTHLGIQTATFANDRWWFGCYGDPKILLVTDAEFQMKGRYEFDCSLGIVGLPDGRFLSASGNCEKDKGCTGTARIAVADEKLGLRIGEN